MNLFDKKYEAINSFRNYTDIKVDISDKIFYANNLKYSSKMEFGDWVLFQHIKSDKLISRPIYGIFTSWNIWDQALVFNFIEKHRAYRYNYAYISNPDNRYEMRLSECDDEIDNIQFWTDNIILIGHWKIKPSISDLKKALYNNLPVDELRDLKINGIL